jgi:hypothetical protein
MSGNQTNLTRASLDSVTDLYQTKYEKELPVDRKSRAHQGMIFFVEKFTNVAAVAA